MVASIACYRNFACSIRQSIFLYNPFMTQHSGHRQLPLALAAPERVDLDLFVAGSNEEVCTRLRTLAAGERGQCIFLWGGSGTGKSHLLQAACHIVGGHGGRSAYMPLGELQLHGGGIFEGLETFDLIAIDDLQVISGNSDWEQALFNFYNRVCEYGGSLLFAATASPRGLGLQLPDLVSRLGWGLVFRLQPLVDADRREALTRRARVRGFELPEEVADYLLRRTSRDIAVLMRFLDQLDTAQLVAQRRLTIPFVKTFLAEAGEA